MLARALIGNRQYFVMGYHEHIWFHQCQEDINSLYHFERISGNFPFCAQIKLLTSIGSILLNQPPMDK